MILKLWIARDRNGMLYLHSKKPIKDDFEFISNVRCTPLTPSLFPEITFDNSPIEFTGYKADSLWQNCFKCTFSVVDNHDGRVICTKLARELYLEEMCPLLKTYYDNIYVGE